MPLGTRPRAKRRRVSPASVILVLCLAVLFVIILYLLLVKPSTEQVLPYEGRTDVILFQGEAYPKGFRLVGEQILLPLDFIKANLDPDVYWDEPTRSVVITTEDHVMRMESGKLVAFLNKTPVELRVPVQEVDGVRYIPCEPLQKLYDFTCTYTSQGVVVVEKDGYSVTQAKIGGANSNNSQSLPLRVGPSTRQPMTATLSPGTVVDVLGEADGWYQVQTTDGLLGYVPKKFTVLDGIREANLSQMEADVRVVWKPLGERINLVWEHVVNKTPDVANIPDMPGLHVVSPTWFELADEHGTILNKADMSYVQWAHQRGYQVWALFSNGFNPDWTKAILADFHKREKVIAQILQYARMYDLDGINLDFENVYVEDKERLTQFVRELTPYLHEQGLTVSMDVTVKSTSDRWSRFYDRAALSRVVDYMIVMAYDEHWATSPVAGSVASLPWTEKGLQGVLEEVPRRKLLLGVPFYTRLWKEERQPDGSTKVTSKALSMSQAEQWLAERKLVPQLDEKSGQRFASYTDPADGATYKLWLEDATSLQKRVELVHKYDLAGVAAWRRGFEKEEIWQSLNQFLRKR